MKDAQVRLVATGPVHTRLLGLDVLRFLAAFVVVCSHAETFGRYGDLFEKTPGILGRALTCFAAQGWEAVAVFFVLSGFLVSGLLFNEVKRTGTVSVFRFLIRRGFKIYPAFWAMIVITILWTWFQGRTVPLSGVCGELLYFQNYGPALHPHTWSLAVEEHFYFLLAGVFMVLKMRSRPGQKLSFDWVPGFFLGLAVLCLALRFTMWAVITSVTNKNYCLFIHSDFALMDFLFFGVYLSHYWYNCWNEEQKRKVIAWRWPRAVMGICLLLTQYFATLDYAWFWLTYIPIYLGAGCLVLSALSLDYIKCPAFVHGLARLGRYSYSVYLFHFLAGSWMAPHLWIKGDNGFMVHVVNALIFVVGCWVIGIILARIIEFPMLRCRDRWFPSP